METTIHVERAKLRMTQEELAKKAGLTRQTIHAIEAGKFIPSTTNALKIAKVFNVNVQDIFKLEEGDE